MNKGTVMKNNRPSTTATKPSEASRLATAVLSVMETLSQVMDREVELLGKQDFAAVTALRDEKAKWSREYRSNMQALMQKPDLLKEASAEERQRLRKQGEVLAQSARRNAGCLRIAIGATQSLVQTVMNVAREQNKSNDCYSDPRKTALTLGSYSPTCTPVAINRTA